MKRSMMRKTTLREIKSTFGRFAAILAIVALGTGFFSGVRVTTPAMVSMINDFLNENQFYDYRLISTMGWDKNSPAEFSEQSGVRLAEGAYSLDVVYKNSRDDEFVLKTHSLTHDINTIVLKDGRLPEVSNECIADSKTGIKTGDVITVSDENTENTLDSLAVKELTVVGTADSPLYINFERGTTSAGNGSVSGFVYLPEEAFDLDYFTEIYVRFNHEYKIYSDEYNDLMDSKTDDWEIIAQKQADLRFDDVLLKAQEEIENGKAELEENCKDGQKELDDAKKELDKGKKELDEALKKLNDSKTEIDDGEKELSDSKRKLDSGKAELEKSKKTLDDTAKQLEASEKQLNEGEAQLAEGQRQIDSARSQLEAAQTEYEAQKNSFYDMYGEALAMLDYLPEEQQAMLREGLAQLGSAGSELEQNWQQLNSQQSEIDGKRNELAAGRSELEAGRYAYQQGLDSYSAALAEITKGEKDYEDGLKKWQDGKKLYEDGLKDYEKGKKDYEDGLAEYKDGLAEFREKISDAETELADAENDLAELEGPEVYLLDRNTNIGYACFENDSEIVAQVAKVFPIFFILVAALVCMTTMSRMVEEQRTQIGMLKALGYSNGRIMGKFMFYSGSASLTGCILGFFFGTYLFPAIIWMTYKLMYLHLDIPYLFDWKLALAAIAVSLLCSLGMTWLSCRYELSETAASLMRPKAPKAGKRVLPERIPFIWNRLKFLHKVSLRNIFRYKGRFFMMVIGIGGCTALLLTGFGLKDSIAGFAQTQYEEIQTADGTLSFNSENTEKIRKLLDEKSDSYTLLSGSSWDILYGNKVKSIELEVTEDFGEMSGFMNFRTLNGDKLEPPKTGEALVCHSIADRYGAVTGSEITLRDENMRELHLTVAGVFENHVYNVIYINSDTYTQQMGDEPDFNTAYVNFNHDEDQYAAAAELSGNENVSSVSLMSETRTRLSNMMSSLDYIVILVIVCAAGLAFIVIYNLTNINITERTREIATIKVLGFFRRETSAYVLRENLALTAIGTLTGLGLGILLHRFIMAQIVVDMVDFSVKIEPISFLFSVVLTFVFNFIVNLFMSAKLERINMAESLKSVD